MGGIMKATLNLYEITSKELIKQDNHGHDINLMYVVKIGPFVKYFRTDRAAWKYLEKMGFKYDHESGQWEVSGFSEDELNLKRHYKKIA